MPDSKMKAKLKTAAEASRDAKEIVRAVVGHARILMDERELHAIQSLALETASNAATIESYLAEFARLGVNGKRFAVSGKETKNQRSR